MTDEALRERWRAKIAGEWPSIAAIREFSGCDVNAAFMFYAAALMAGEMANLIGALDRHATALATFGAGRFRMTDEGEPWSPPTTVTVERTS